MINSDEDPFIHPCMYKRLIKFSICISSGARGDGTVDVAQLQNLSCKLPFPLLLKPIRVLKQSRDVLCIVATPWNDPKSK